MKALSLTIHGVQAKKKLSHWIPMCKSWAFNIERYARLTEEGDAPYDNNERANVGLLAGAAWSCGNVALEEFQTTKGAEGDEKQGRIDLWLCNEESKEEYVEAKFKRTSVKGNYLKNVQGALDSAVSDAKFSKGDADIDSIGVAFIVFYMKEAPLEDVIHEMDTVIHEISVNIKCDLVSWCFPDKDMKHVFSDGYIVPGIVMVAKRA